MKTQRKMLQISLEYEDPREAVKQLEKVINNLKKPRINYGRESEGKCVLQWEISHVDFVEHRIELIDGRQCIVIPSKMNEDE